MVLERLIEFSKNKEKINYCLDDLHWLTYLSEIYEQVFIIQSRVVIYIKIIFKDEATDGYIE